MYGFGQYWTGNRPELTGNQFGVPKPPVGNKFFQKFMQIPEGYDSPFAQMRKATMNQQPQMSTMPVNPPVPMNTTMPVGPASNWFANMEGFAPRTPRPDIPAPVEQTSQTPQTFADYYANGTINHGDNTLTYAQLAPEGSMRYGGLQNRFNNMQSAMAGVNPNQQYGTPASTMYNQMNALPPNGYGNTQMLAGTKLPVGGDISSGPPKGYGGGLGPASINPNHAYTTGDPFGTDNNPYST